MIYQTTTYGKWILSGEHAVLRGHPAMVFPLGNFSLELNYQAHQHALNVLADKTMQQPILKIWQLAGGQNKGQLSINSNIPIGQGMGASAALCLAIARAVLQHAPYDEIFNLARRLEHEFHGQSSGLDIVGAGSQHGAIFQAGYAKELYPQWQTCFLLSPSQDIGHTKDAIAKVNALFYQNPITAQKIDDRMHQSVMLCKSALESSSIHLEPLIEGINIANQCFKDWGLVTTSMQTLEDRLFELGALAVKPTGSGGGGLMLSLWKEDTLDGLDLPKNWIKIHPPGYNTFHQV